MIYFYHFYCYYFIVIDIIHVSVVCLVSVSQPTWKSSLKIALEVTQVALKVTQVVS